VLDRHVVESECLANFRPHLLLPSKIGGGHLSFLVNDTEVSSLSESADNLLNMLGDLPRYRAGRGVGPSVIHLVVRLASGLNFLFVRRGLTSFLFTMTRGRLL